MLADPVDIAAASPTPALSLAIVSSDGMGSVRTDTGDNGYTVTTNHTKQKGGGSKHYVQMTKSVVAPDPISGVNKTYIASCSLTIVRPLAGFTSAEMVALCKALTDYRDDSQVTTARLLQFQS